MTEPGTPIASGCAENARRRRFSTVPAVVALAALLILPHPKITQAQAGNVQVQEEATQLTLPMTFSVPSLDEATVSGAVEGRVMDNPWAERPYDRVSYTMRPGDLMTNSAAVTYEREALNFLTLMDGSYRQGKLANTDRYDPETSDLGGLQGHPLFASAPASPFALMGMRPLCEGVGTVDFEAVEGHVLVETVWDADWQEHLVVVLIVEKFDEGSPGVADRMYVLQAQDAPAIAWMGPGLVEYELRTLSLTESGRDRAFLELTVDRPAGTVDPPAGKDAAPQGATTVLRGHGLARHSNLGTGWEVRQSGLSEEQRQQLTSCDVPDDPESGCAAYGGTGLCEYECYDQGGQIMCGIEETCCGWCQYHITVPNHGCVRCLKEDGGGGS